VKNTVQLEWLWRQLSTSELLLPAGLLDGSSRPRRPEPTSGGDGSTPPPLPPPGTSPPATTPGAERASALGKMEKALAAVMNRVHQLTETVFELEALMRQLVRNGRQLSRGSVLK